MFPAYQDSSRFTHFARLGSGRQIVKNTEHKDNQISTSYQYLTGEFIYQSRYIIPITG